MLSIKNNQEVVFSESLLENCHKIMQRYPEGKQKSALLPVLHLVQAELGWLPASAMEQVAQLLDIEAIEVFEVATFYTMFLLKPQGKHLLEICRTGPCCLVGAEQIMEHLQQRLGVAEGEVTVDGLFSWRGVECLAACGYGPVLQIGPSYTFYENLTPDSVDELIDSLTAQAKSNTHGA